MLSKVCSIFDLHIAGDRFELIESWIWRRYLSKKFVRRQMYRYHKDMHANIHIHRINICVGHKWWPIKLKIFSKVLSNGGCGNDNGADTHGGGRLKEYNTVKEQNPINRNVETLDWEIITRYSHIHTRTRIKRANRIGHNFCILIVSVHFNIGSVQYIILKFSCHFPFSK